MNIKEKYRKLVKINLYSQWILNVILQKIKNEASIHSISEKLSVGEARKPENRSKNRYRDVSPCKKCVHIYPFTFSMLA